MNEVILYGGLEHIQGVAVQPGLQRVGAEGTETDREGTTDRRTGNKKLCHGENSGKHGSAV